MNFRCLVGIHHWYRIRQEFLRIDLKGQKHDICTRCHKTRTGK